MLNMNVLKFLKIAVGAPSAAGPTVGRRLPDSKRYSQNSMKLQFP
jgi:hypothetical protein